MSYNVKQAYQILGISEDATKEDVKKAYRTLCKKFHPDRNTAPNAVECYIEVQQAYKLIVESRQYCEKVSKSVPYAAYHIFYKNTHMGERGEASPVQGTEYQSEQKNSSTFGKVSFREKKILGNNLSYQRKYEEMQQRNARKRKLEQERKAQLKEKERKEREELAARIKRRKLPSEREAEKREKIAVQKEAERIAEIIEKLMR